MRQKLKTLKSLSIQPAKERVKDSRGFTLVEIVAVVVVLAIAIPVLVNLISSILVGSEESVVLSKASIFAQDKLEEIIADKKSPAKGYAYVIADGRYADDTPESGYTRAVSIAGAGNVHNGVTFALVEVVVSHSHIPDVKLTTWFTDY